MAIKRLGTLLVEEQLITEEQLDEALAQQKTSGEALGEALVRMGFITEEPLFRFLAIQHGLEFSALDGVEIPAQLINLVPSTIAWKYQAVPVKQDNGVVTFATSQPDELSLFYLPKELRLPEETHLKIVVSTLSQITDLLKKHFPKTDGKIGGQIQSMERAQNVEEEPDAPPDQDQINLLQGVEQELIAGDDVGLEILDEEPEDEAEDEVKDTAPIIKMCNYIIANAVRNRVSDIHITPYEKKIIMRYRIDGSLIEFPAPPVSAKRRIATRYKIMANLNIIEKRIPQDGRIHLSFGSKSVDVRISTMPTRYGENIVMRIVDQSSVSLDLNTIGFEPDQLEQFKKAISQPYGMVFVTGPTASGKTTTLFAALTYINTPTKNIVTVEDPVELRLPHIIQIQVDAPAGRTFEAVLRAFLRHDPNIMLVGEIRDPQTADIAVKASLTGHLVLSSLHTNDAPASIMRLVGLGIDPVYVGSSVLCVASQRLLRRICEKCRVEVHPTVEELHSVGLTPEDVAGSKFFRGEGCEACRKSGYYGRIAIFEVMTVTASIREIIFSRGTLNQLKAAANESGFKNLRQNALAKWKKGLVTLEEVLSETFE